MKKAVLYLVVGAVGLGAGIGTGILVNKPKLEQSQTALSELQAKMEESEKTGLEKLQQAAADKTRLESELRRINTELIRYKTEYVRASADLNKLKESIIPQDQVDALSQQITQMAASQSGSTVAKPAAAVATGGGAATAPAKPVVAAGEYVIKDGDNLWKIAADQLGNGIRYKEILALNPGIKENTTLAVGSKIRLPAR